MAGGRASGVGPSPGGWWLTADLPPALLHPAATADERRASQRVEKRFPAFVRDFMSTMYGTPPSLSHLGH